MKQEHFSKIPITHNLPFYPLPWRLSTKRAYNLNYIDVICCYQYASWRREMTALRPVDSGQFWTRLSHGHSPTDPSIKMINIGMHKSVTDDGFLIKSYTAKCLYYHWSKRVREKRNQKPASVPLDWFPFKLTCCHLFLHTIGTMTMTMTSFGMYIYIGLLWVCIFYIRIVEDTFGQIFILIRVNTFALWILFRLCSEPWLSLAGPAK